MDNNFDNLKRLIQELRSMSFLSRIFSWKKIKDLLFDAAADLQKLIAGLDHNRLMVMRLESENSNLRREAASAVEAALKKENEVQRLNDNIRDATGRISQLTSANSSQGTTIDAFREKIAELRTDNDRLNERIDHYNRQNKRLSEEIASKAEAIATLSARKLQLENELSESKGRLQGIRSDCERLTKENTRLLKDEEFRQAEHSNCMATLSKIQAQIQSERSAEIELRNQAEIRRIRALKETWSRHQEWAKSIIKSICQKYTIQYIDKVSFKGDPDNTLFICEEYIVFDAKSPGGDDLANFPAYLKDQAEKAKKYAKQENVKTDVFFVVPSNTLDHLRSFVYKHDTHNVFIISVDALEPVILSLKKIEEYDFAEQLSPDERENICRVLGQFAHLSKRRIQIDSYFAKQFIELAYRCETDLPSDILLAASEFEKTGKLNPPMEKRAKAIPIAEIEKDSGKIRQEASAKGIAIQEETIAKVINGLPLYNHPEA